MNHKEMIERLRVQSCTGDCDGGLISDAADELERIIKGVQYWSYCMDQGMMKTCPENVSELHGFLESLGIEPYHVRNTLGETVRVARGPLDWSGNDTAKMMWDEAEGRGH